jgi:putative ABC transport system substrate-binding protein
MNNRRKLVIALGAGALTVPFAPRAQQARKIARIGVMIAAAESGASAFDEGLRERGWIEGKNILVERRQLGGSSDGISSVVSELIGLNVDVIVASSNPVISALKRATQTMPIVMSVVGDPVGAGFVASLARPGGNITGLSQLAEAISAKRLEILKEIHTKAARVAVLRNPSIPTHAVLFGETEAAARVLGLKLLPADIGAPDAIEAAFNLVVKQRADSLVVLPDPIGLARRAAIAGFAAQYRLPAVYPFSEFVEAGGLASYGASQRDLWRRSAGYVDKLLKGAKPAELPVEQPTTFEFVVNLITAKALGIKIPNSILVRANKVIE